MNCIAKIVCDYPMIAGNIVPQVSMCWAATALSAAKQLPRILASEADDVTLHYALQTVENLAVNGGIIGER